MGFFFDNMMPSKFKLKIFNFDKLELLNLTSEYLV